MNINELEGKVCTEVRNADDAELWFYCSDGSVYRLYHAQSCCESVYIEDICGDLTDLVGTPIMQAAEVEGSTSEYQNGRGECEEWTFYKLRTHKGEVTIRWYGTSNGYYSTSVSFEKTR